MQATALWSSQDPTEELDNCTVTNKPPGWADVHI